jgi:hypothetical protein
MRIERNAGSDLPVVAHLNEAEARVLSRSVDALPGFLQAARGALRRANEAGASLTASFRDEAALGAFLDRFMPGVAPVGGVGLNSLHA